MKNFGSSSVWESSLTLFEMTHGLCSCHPEQSEKSCAILTAWWIENEPLPKLLIKKKKGRSDPAPLLCPMAEFLNYQRLRPPPPPPPRRSPPRSPKPPERLSCGRASFTVRFRPSRSVPLRAWMAFWASSEEAISTKPKPRERPVNLSVITRADSTAPWAEKISWSCASVVAYGKPPT